MKEKMKTRNMKTQADYSPVEAIVNINKRQLTTEKSMLNKGLNFANTIKRIPYLDLIAPIEDASLKIPKAQADELRWKVRQALEKSESPKPNISKAERQAIKSQQNHNNIIILQADKGNATVLMDRVDY